MAGRRLATLLVLTATISCGGATEPQEDNPTPTVTSLGRDTATVGIAPFAVAIYGAEFMPGAKGLFDGNERSSTFNSSGLLVIQLVSGDLSSVGDHEVRVKNPAPGGGPSTALQFEVLPLPPVPVLDSLSPDTVNAGGAAFTLHVHGTGFAGNSVIRWNGGALTTSFVSATHLTASISADAIAFGGSVNITVFTGAPGGGTSSLKTLVIIPNT